jgi:diguanylate cyclase (GGDEF)-like protein/PAS domain S-box-containing protein
MGTIKSDPIRGSAPAARTLQVQQMQQVLEQSGEAIIVKDMDAVVMFWNREASILYGFTAEEAIGRPLRALHAADLSDADYAKVLARVRAGKPTESTSERRKKSGETIRVFIKTTSLTDAQGNLIGEITVARDITLLYRTEEALRSSQATLEAKVSAIAESNRKLTTTVRKLEAFHHHGEALSRMAELLQACSERTEAYEVIRETAAELFPDVPGALYIYRETRDMLERASTWSGAQTDDSVLAPGDCWALRLGRPHIVRPQNTVRCAHVSDGARGYVCMPVQGQGQVVGLLHFAFDSGGQSVRFPAETERRLRALSDSVGPALANLQLRDALRMLALRDGLTELYNRRYLEEALQREVNRAERSTKPLSLIMIDVDHFKRFNDNFGHDAGDLVLSTLARVITVGVRSSDIACRYGGEELAVVLPEADAAGAAQRAEALRSAIAETTLTHRGQSLPGATASFGVASYPAHADSPADLVIAADKALYLAKESGRDRVCVADAGTTS